MTFVRPAPDEARVVVLGKDAGESIAVHLGNDEWIVVDSFLGEWDDGCEVEPAALGYLRALGYDDPGDVVSNVVLTHLHADHCEGIERLVTACSDATLWMPDALPRSRWDDVLNVVIAEAGATAKTKMHAIASAFRITKETGRFRLIHSYSEIDVAHGKVHALSPVGRAAVSARVDEDEDERDLAKLLRENATSIVLWVQVGGAAALLGADMDNHQDLGWPAMLVELRNKAELTDAGLVKIAHHGSEASQHREMFEAWTNQPVGIIAPHRRARFDLPKLDKLGLLHDHTTSIWLAGPQRRASASGPYDAASPPRTWWVEASAPGGQAIWHVRSGDDQEQHLPSPA